jgi:hypothetical protein
MIADVVSTLGSGVADWARRIDRFHEIRGLLETVTTYSDTAGTARGPGNR